MKIQKTPKIPLRTQQGHGLWYFLQQVDEKTEDMALVVGSDYSGHVFCESEGAPDLKSAIYALAEKLEDMARSLREYGDNS